MTEKFFRMIKKNFFNRSMKMLPMSLRDKFIREQVILNYNPPENLIFKLATTKEELEAAYQLLYHSYVSSGSMKDNSIGLRITPYHALPSTSVLIACLDNKVVATLSIFRGSSFGLPISKISDVSQFDALGLRYAEISSLCVADEFKNESRELLFGLLKFLYEYATSFFGIDVKLAVIKPFRKFFYESSLLFVPFDNKIFKNYQFSNGASVMSMKLNLQTAPGLYQLIYNDFPDQHNLYKYFIETKIENFKFPKRNFNKISDPVMTPDLLYYFFSEKTNILRNLNPYESMMVQQIYNSPDYEHVFKESNSHGNLIPFKAFNTKRENRIDTKCKGILFGKNKTIYSLQVKNVSLAA